MMATEPPGLSTLNTMRGLGISLTRPNAPPLRPPNPFNPQTPRPALTRPPATDPAQPKMISLRSTTGMKGLVAAESGAGMVQLDYSGRGSGFKAGGPIAPGSITPAPKTRKSIQHLVTSLPSSTSLERQPTLFTRDASPQRNAAELKSVLGAPSSGRLQTNATVIPPTGTARIRKRAQSEPNPAAAAVALEQAKPKARVELDVILESETCVEGGYMKGYLQVKIRKGGKSDGPVYLGGGKIRVVGFEGLCPCPITGLKFIFNFIAIPQNDDRHTFYQHSAPLSEITATTHLLYTSAPDREGFCRGREGTHTIPFAMKLPASDGKLSEAKGSLQLRNGASVRYISMASIRVKDGRTGARSIAHFYRNIEVWPSYDPSRVLAPAPSALYSTAAKPVFMGGSGKLKLTASIHREIWIAGQRCYVKVFVANDTTKKMKNVTLTLIRADTIFRLNPDLDATSPTSKSAGLDVDACQTSTTRKVVAETVLEMASKGTSGYATAKGWWTGVEAGSSLEFVHYILLPVSVYYRVRRVANDLMFQPDALSMTRSRLLEVSHFVRVTIGTGALSSEVSVQLPIRVINFISIDPIPSFAPSRAILPPKRQTGSVETERQRSRSMDDVREIRLIKAVFGSRFVAPGVGIIASDGTYRGDTTLHPIGRLEVRNFTPPEVLMRRVAEQRLQEVDTGLSVDASEEPRYPQDPETMKPAITDGGETQGELLELQCVGHAREPDSASNTTYFGDSSIEGSPERQQPSIETEGGAIPLTAYSSTATQRMYNVSQEASPRGSLPNPSDPRDQHPTSLYPGDTTGGHITSDEEVDILLDSVNPDEGSNIGALQDPGIKVNRGETSEYQPNVHVHLQEGPLRKSPVLSRGPFDVPSPVESVSMSASPSPARRMWQVGSRPPPTTVRQQSSASTVASSMQSSRATSMASGVDIRTSGSYSTHDSSPGTKIGGPRPAQERPTWRASAAITQKYTPDTGRGVTRTSRNIATPVKGGAGGLVLQPRPLPTSRTTARRSMVEGGPRTSTRTTFGLKSQPPGPIKQPIYQQTPSSERETASGSPSKEPKTSYLKTAVLENKDDPTGPHPCDKSGLGEDTAPTAGETLHQATKSEDPHFIPPTVSALMRTDIQSGIISTSVLRGPRPAPERQPTRQLKGEATFEDISRSAPPLPRKWENDGRLTYLQQLDTTPTPLSRARLSAPSTPSKAFPLGPTSVKSRIAMLEEKTKTLDGMPRNVMSGRWSATSVGPAISSGQSCVRPLSNSSAVTSESSVSTYCGP